MDKSTDPIHILLIEDNAGDALLIRLALREAGLDFQLEEIDDGARAVEYASGSDGRALDPMPDLVLLDLNLPCVDGKDVLARFCSAPALSQVPVVILTCSESMADKLAAVALGARGYVQKPYTLGEYLRLGRDIRDLWYAMLRPPPPA